MAPGTWRRSYALAGLVWVSCAAVASASPVRILSFKDLADGSGVVVCGVVRETTQLNRVSVALNGEQIPAFVVRSILQVEDVLKGDAVPAQLAFETVDYENPTIPRAEVVKGQYRVYFLVQRPDGTYGPTNPVQLSMPAAPFSGRKAPYVSEQVADFVGAVLTQPGVSPRQRQEAVLSLGASQEPHASIPLRLTLSDSDQSVRLSGAAFLLDLGDESALPTVESALLNPQQVPAQSIRQLRETLRALPEQVLTPAFVNSCKRLTESADLETRRVAVIALAHSRSPGAIATLAKALVAGDREQQVAAERGLQMITGQRPPNELMRANDAAGISAFWVNWARTQGLIK